ncbi:MAG: FecR domain-containing protein [Pseudomonadota bacterium]|nr:FecR domain-containing protein [Pseudomonadota bacterium]
MSTQRLVAPANHRPLLMALALLIAIPAVVFFFLAPANNDSSAEVEAYATGAGENRSLSLEDGSEVRLNDNTGIAVRYDTQQRRVQLTTGSATFIVAPDPQRPFWAQSGTLRLRADAASAFAVRLNHESVMVQVYEGTLRAQSSGKVQTLNAGDTVVLALNH